MKKSRRYRLKRNTRNTRKNRCIKKRRGGSYGLCKEHSIYVKDNRGRLDKASSVKGIINKFKCYIDIKNNSSYDSSIRDTASTQMDSLIERLIDLEREKKGILLKYLITNDYYKSLSDDDLKAISLLMTRMQEEALPLSMPILDYLMRERRLL